MGGAASVAQINHLQLWAGTETCQPHHTTLERHNLSQPRRTGQGRQRSHHDAFERADHSERNAVFDTHDGRQCVLVEIEVPQRLRIDRRPDVQLLSHHRSSA